MSLLTRPSVVFAIVFGCFAVLIPRVFLPLFRTKPQTPSQNFDDRFRRSSHPMHHDENTDHIQHIPGSPPHMRGAHPSMRMHHPGGGGGGSGGGNNRQQQAPDQSSSRSIVTLALPMYTIGIGVFFIYTCCKYWSKRNSNDADSKKKHANNPFDKRKPKLDILDKNSEGEDDENKEEFYGRLDPDYIEYLKAKKQKALEAEQAMTDEQKQMHFALEEMKKSLSYISAKLVSKESRGNLTGHEINKLQERLATTEAQMCKILTALDSASDKVARKTKKKAKLIKIEDVKDVDDKQEEEEEEGEEGEEDVQSSEDESVSSDEGVPDQSGSSSNSNSSEEEHDDDDDQSAPIDQENRSSKQKSD